MQCETICLNYRVFGPVPEVRKFWSLVALMSPSSHCHRSMCLQFPWLFHFCCLYILVIIDTFSLNLFSDYVCVVCGFVCVALYVSEVPEGVRLYGDEVVVSVSYPM